MIASMWNAMTHWDLVLPPSRPSASELARIRQIAAQLDRSLPVAILGSTPEFRDLLFEAGFINIYVLEKNRAFHDSVSTLRVYANPEIFIEGDWLQTLPHFSSRFALILSDLTSGNIPYENRSSFYGLIKQALRPQGFFVDKILTHPIPHIPLDSLIRKYSELPLNLLYINQFSCEVLFCSELLSLANIVDSSNFYRQLTDVSDNRVRSFARHSEQITPPGFVWWYGRAWQQLVDDYCPGLLQLSVEEDESSSPYCRRLKIFVHKKEEPQ
jgi:hypothetical protein